MYINWVDASITNVKIIDSLKFYRLVYFCHVFFSKIIMVNRILIIFCRRLYNSIGLDNDAIRIEFLFGNLFFKENFFTFIA